MRPLLPLLLLVASLLGAQDTTVLLLRHAEKVSEAPDAELSPAGLQRARAWIPRLSPFHPTALYASDRRRTQQTLAPAAGALGLPLEIRPAAGVQDLVQEVLRRHRGSTVAICGHSNTLAPLARGLGLVGPLDWPETEFGRLWVLVIPATGAPRLETRNE